MQKKPIPHINVPIMTKNGSMELAWYLFLQWVSENASAADLSDYFTKEETQTLLDAKANIDDLADVAFSGSYNDLSNKPTIGNATITIKQGGVTKGSFTVNQTGDEEIDIDQGGSDIDNLTITKNTDNKMQAVGTINKNAEVSATNPIYDWVGTLAEYNAQDIENQHPDWICYIIDDVSGGDSVYTKAEVDNNFVGKGHEVIEFQVPIAANNYTWYRKYRDGWVEQGGFATSSESGTICNFPITMANNKYTAQVTVVDDGASNYSTAVIGRNTTHIYITTYTETRPCSWFVCGMAA